MKRVLIANIFGIGDVLFTTPIIANLKQVYPDIEISYLCNGRVKDIISNDPGIDEVFVYEKDDIIKTWRTSKGKGIKAVFELYNRIKGAGFDAVFDFTLSRGFGFLFLLAGIKRRIGFNYKKRGIFLTDKIDIKGFEGKHVVEYYLDLLRKIRIPVTHKNMRLVPGPGFVARARKFLDEKNITGRPIVAVVPGGGASWGEMSYRKRWDAGNFAEVAKVLSDKGCSILVGGDNKETDLCQEVIEKVKNVPSSVMTGLPIELYAAVLSLCDLVLCNDGGPLHMASAMGVKTVSIFGPVDDKVYGPYPPGENCRVIVSPGVECRPCYRNFKVPECRNDGGCLKKITVGRIIKACEELLRI